MNRFFKPILGMVVTLCATVFVFFLIQRSSQPTKVSVLTGPLHSSSTVVVSTSTSVVPSSTQGMVESPESFRWPISRPEERLTKKQFGTYVEPGNSVVMPERFKGYHTGLDFETFTDEVDSEVVISAICSGKILQARTATGYGGVAVQSCTLDGAPVTVVYGHLKLATLGVNVGQTVNVGEKMGVLGKGGSSETDGERKHLHLSIHRGTGINILGYVSTKAGLKDWIDPTTVLSAAK